MPLGVAVLYNFKSGVAIVRVLEYNRHINHGGRIMEIMSAREAANKWGISQRRVALLCSEGRIAPKPQQNRLTAEALDIQ